MGTSLCIGSRVTNMPGHVAKTVGPDPSPDQWLYASDELKVKLKSKPYDPKKSCWVPEKGTGGYLEGLIESVDGEKVSVKFNVSKEVKVFKQDQVGQVNPPKFDCSDDMAGLTYLNDACVLWNSVVRYINQLIYTYSGLFCIAINPYIRFPIYTQRAMEIYMGLRRQECPPHIFGVAEQQYQGMMNNGKNQSILITGESGAGKTENTKKDKDAAGAVMKVIALDPEKFRLGHTKIFFRAGVLGFMEEVREERIGNVLSWLQAQARGKASRLLFQKLQAQKLALYCLQRTIRNYYIGKTWLWWQLWLAIKPNLKCTKFAQYKAEYEEKIALADAHMDKVTAECSKVKTVYDRICNEKNELVLALQSGGSAVQDIIDKTNRIEAMKNDLQKQMNETNARIQGEEDAIATLGSQSNKVQSDADKLTASIKTLESGLEATEEDKMTKDNQIRTLKEEVAHQEDMVAKLQKEKRSVGDSRQKTEEDIQAMEDKCNHLNKGKGKLEQALDECEDSLEKEKKAKGDVEKLKRKVEGDLKLTQEAVSDLERVKSELSQTIQRKEKETASLAAKIEDEQTLGSKYHKQVKELQSRLEELDEELTIERQNRAKAEKNRSTLSRDIGDLAEKLEDAGNNTATQIELNKKREAELAKLKGELGESNIAHEGTLAALRQKHNNNMSEMGEQIDGLNKMKAKAEKDKAGMERDLQEARGSLDEAMRDRANHERNGKLTGALIVESNVKLDDMARALNEADSSRKKLQVENQDLPRQIDEVEAAFAALGKNKISLSTQ